MNLNSFRQLVYSLERQGCGDPSSRMRPNLWQISSCRPKHWVGQFQAILLTVLVLWIWKQANPSSDIVFRFFMLIIMAWTVEEYSQSLHSNDHSPPLLKINSKMIYKGKDQSPCKSGKGLLPRYTCLLPIANCVFSFVLNLKIVTIIE